MSATNDEIRAVPGETPAPPYTPKDQNPLARPEAVYSPHPQPVYNQESNNVVPLWRLQEHPELVDCPFCHRRTQTRVHKEASGITYLAGGLLCLFCICLACLPCMLGWAENVDHYCSACNRQLTHKPHDDIVQVVEAAKNTQGGGPGPNQVPSQYTAGPQPPAKL